MKAVLHIGLHKTGTTFIQHAAHSSREDLKASGIHYHPSEFEGHHREAWDLLRGGTRGIETMVRAARDSGCATMLVSSEDLESLLFRPDVTTRLIETLASHGIADAEFVIHVRRPDTLFWSLHAELSKHLFVDVFHMFADILRLGYVFIDDPRPHEDRCPYWYFCFDHPRYIGAFARFLAEQDTLPCRVRVHDFDARAGQPGQDLFDGIGASLNLDAVAQRMQNANASMPPNLVARRYVNTLTTLATRAGIALPPALVRSVRWRMRLRKSRRGMISAALLDRFAADHADFVARLRARDGLVEPGVAPGR